MPVSFVQHASCSLNHSPTSQMCVLMDRIKKGSEESIQVPLLLGEKAKVEIDMWPSYDTNY